MNPFEFSRKLAKITEPVIRKLSIEAVIDNEDIVVSDAIVPPIVTGKQIGRAHV